MDGFELVVGGGGSLSYMVLSMKNQDFLKNKVGSLWARGSEVPRL